MMMALALPATAAEYTTIDLEKTVDRPVDQVWAKIGDYCAIKDWLKLTCAITSGDGKSVGSNRRLRDTIDELMVAKTRYSYTYAQPTSPIFYHGTLAAEPIDAKHTRLLYNLMYDIAPLTTPEARATDRASRTKRFSEALDAMKALAEAQ